MRTAPLTQFAEACAEAGVDPARTARNFTVSYESDIPRMVGLSGSSAIVTAAVFSLLRFYGLDAERDLKIPKARLPQLILDCELHELGITAGLQDRVVQV